METTGTKEAAESVLRELPSVLGAFVQEDAHGYPRDVHLLITAGPNARHFALDVRTLLEERLGIAIDQRIISVAQLAASPDRTLEMLLPPLSEDSADDNAAVEAGFDKWDGEHDTGAELATAGQALLRPRARLVPRVRFLDASSEVVSGRVAVTVRLDWAGETCEATAVEVETTSGRLRAAARALLDAVNLVIGMDGLFELDSAAAVRTIERDYALVSTVATSPALGRRPISLAGAHVIDDDPATAAALAALKSVNRLLGRLVRPADADEPEM